MALQEQDRVYIREYLGFGSIFKQNEPRLEAAMTAVQSLADGGSQPDSNTENALKSLLYGSSAQTGNPVTPGPTAQTIQFAMPPTLGLLQLEAQLSAMWGFSFAAGKQDEATVDVARGNSILRREGRRLVSRMARILGMRGPRCDMFSSGQIVTDDNPFMHPDAGDWRAGP